MSTAFSISGTLNYPPDDGQPVASRPYSQSGNFDSKLELDLVLTGAGTHVVGMGTVAAVKGMLIEVTPTSQASVSIKINGGDDEWEVSPGGFIAYSNPTPDEAIEDISIVYAADCRVQLRALG
jgi:hypothetical protein